MKPVTCILMLAMIIVACGKQKKCRQADSIDGIISESIDLPEGGEVGAIGYGYSIENDSVYKLCFSGYTEPLPTIDFSKNTLLGYPSTTSCNVSYHRNVEANQETHVYMYKLTVYKCQALYAKGCSNPNWVLVPKLPAGWRVEFEREIM